MTVGAYNLINTNTPSGKSKTYSPRQQVLPTAYKKDSLSVTSLDQNHRLNTVLMTSLLNTEIVCNTVQGGLFHIQVRSPVPLQVSVTLRPKASEKRGSTVIEFVPNNTDFL